ncbi:hypothetical protein C1645_740115 [Glomus cerebriforme]|uniref:Uncharacterized protein n=1 Tax=Glomus cerebriforme TaxID=658196 RepID=A0A397SP26_9GLOM|nr:hypothetical protein C1645_740115 [Glomus cerebriforme]
MLEMPTSEVENVRLTKIMKRYEYLKRRVDRYLIMTLIIYLSAVIFGGGVLIFNDDIDNIANSNKNKPLDKNNEPNSLPESILASISGLVSIGTFLSDLLSTIKSKLSKDENDVFFVVKNQQPGFVFVALNNNNNGIEKKIEKRNNKLKSVRNKYYLISIVGAFLLIIFIIIILKAIFKERNSIKDGSPEDCQIFTDCLDFMKSQNLRIGEFEIICNVTGTAGIIKKRSTNEPRNMKSPAAPNYGSDSPYINKLDFCQKDVFGCNAPENMNLLANYYNNIASPRVKYYFDNCYGYVYYTDYDSNIFALIIMLIGCCGVVHYLSIISIIYNSRGLWLFLRSVFILIILLNLSIVGLVPGCCCQKVDDYEEIQCCCCINIKVSRIFFTDEEEDYLYDLQRNRKSNKAENV